MITEGSEHLDRPVEEGFAFVADVRNDPRWHSDVLEARLTDGVSVGKGSIFEIRTKPFMSVPLEGALEVLDVPLLAFGCVPFDQRLQ